MGPKQPVRNWYNYACIYMRAAPSVRKEVSRQARSHYRAIATRIPPPLGEILDRLEAPFHVVRWIAGVEERNALVRRHAAALEQHERTGRWPQWTATSTLAEAPSASADRRRLTALMEDAERLSTTAPRLIR